MNMAPHDMPQSHVVPYGDTPVYLDKVKPLDPNLFSLSEEAATFFKASTGINDDEELKKHILITQEMAYRVAPYPCIYGFGYLRLGITKNPAYKDILEIARKRKDAILLDIGCCFAVDARKAVADGFSACNVVASDLIPEFWEFSHALFRTSKDTWPAHFVAGDALDPSILSIVPPAQGAKQTLPDLSNLTSLNPLHGHCSVINASAFFHLFSEEQQLHLARALAGLLSPEPGSIICGVQVGATEKGIVTLLVNGRDYDHFSHSPRSWTAMWDGEVFEKGEVEITAVIRKLQLMDVATELLFWSVKRL